ncbi:MAG: DUF2029 domain-containing protein [Alphaproteobacteria bacterium]|nr:DUF2029 domain-containing protein [Alphaproteobacteria bacterium]
MPLIESWLVRSRLRTLALLTAGITVAAMALQLMGSNGLVLANGQPVFGDFLAFWSAGRLALEGHPDLVYSEPAIQIAHREALPALGDIVFPWRHPPPFLLLAAPLALIPFPISAILFLAGTGWVFLYAARRFSPAHGDMIIAAAAPAALLHIGSVQTGLLTAGLAALAFVWLDRRPLASGVLIGLMVIKPHLAALWPILLALQGRWRTIAAAAATALSILAMAGLVFGFDLYAAFVAALPSAMEAVEKAQIERDTLTSLYANLLGLSAPPALAAALHWSSALAAVGVAAAVWLKRDPSLSAAAFACATVLLSPYLFFYDETMLLIAVAALYPMTTSTSEKAWLAFAWAAGALSLAAGKVLTIPISAIAAWALLLIAAARAGIMLQGNAAPRPAPEPRT